MGDVTRTQTCVPIFCQGDNFALFLAAAAAVVLTKLFFFLTRPRRFILGGGGADAGLRSHVLTG